MRAASAAAFLECLESRTHLNVGFMPMGAPGVAPLVVADFNGDGVLDVAGNPYPYSTLAVSLSNGDGTFAVPIVRPDVAQQLVAADFDGDGRVDLVADRHVFFHGNGDGTFADPVDIPLAAGATGAAAIDYNRDGKADLAISDSDGNLRILTSTGMGFTAGPIIQVGPGLIVRGAAPSHVGGESSVVMLYNEGGFTQMVRVETDGTLVLTDHFVASLSIMADLNNDGEADLVRTVGSGLVTALSLGRGFFGSSRVALDGIRGSLLAIGDLDGDGSPDAVLVRATQSYRVQDLVVVFGNGDGTFSANFGEIVTEFVDDTPQSAFAAPFLNDGGAGIVVNSNRGTRGFATTPAPIVASLTAQSNPITPPQSATLTAGGISGPRPIRATYFYLDSNGNGILDYTDQAVGFIDGDSGTATFTDVRNAAGHYRWFVVAADTSYVYSAPVSAEADIWYRIFYPEGWRNDTTINEYVPLVNPNDTEVSYRIVARYEVGDRDEVIAEGVIAPHSRGGVTISERNHPESALVRLNEGYALDVFSSLSIGATLSHYDDFGGGTSGGTANGEAFGDATSTTWAFADVSTRSFDFVLFFDPMDHDATVTMTFRSGVNTLVVRRAIGALRRSGVALRDAGLDPDADYSVTISADSPVVACMSRYTADGTGFSSLGQRAFGVASLNAVVPLVEFRTGMTNSVVLFNTGDAGADVTVVTSYQEADIPDRTRMYHLTPGLRLVLDPGENLPGGATRATLRITGTWTVLEQYEGVDAIRGDSVGTGPGNTTATTWAFADGFLDRDTAGTVGFETISIYNPGAGAQTATVRFLFSDGFTITRTVQIEAGRTANLDLHLDQELIGHSQLNFFSTVVTGESPLIASMTHWDLFQGGGWETLGTPIGTTGTLG